MTNLFSPLTLPCGLVFPNRLVKSATSEQLASEHRLPTPHHRALYARWARGGVGAMVTGNVMVDVFRRAARGDVAVVASSPMPPFRAWASAAAGTPFLMQLSHPGRQSPRNLDAAPVAPSVTRVRRGGALFAEPKALDREEIRAIVEAFAFGARHAEAAGFSGVQIHAAHGYLVHQFLSARTNTRDDAYGGDASRRLQFLREILAAIRDVVRPSFAVAVKLNVPETIEDDAVCSEWLEVVRMLERFAVDAVELSGGTYDRDAVIGVKARKVSVDGVKHEAVFAREAALLRSHAKIPIFLTGGIRSRIGAARAVESGLADAIGLARWLIVEPDLPMKLARGESVDAALSSEIPMGRFAAPLELAWYEQRLLALAGKTVELRPRGTLMRVLRKYAW